MSGAHGDSSNAIRTDLGAIFVSLELSRSKWVITSLSPGAGEKLSRGEVPAGSAGALLDHFAELQRRAQARCGEEFAIIAIQEAGLDGFWLHRVLEQEGIESHVVDPASIATRAATTGSGHACPRELRSTAILLTLTLSLVKRREWRMGNREW